jgi:hypothetical protein
MRAIIALPSYGLFRAVQFEQGIAADGKRVARFPEAELYRQAIAFNVRPNARDRGGEV